MGGAAVAALLFYGLAPRNLLDLRYLLTLACSCVGALVFIGGSILQRARKLALASGAVELGAEGLRC